MAITLGMTDFQRFGSLWMGKNEMPKIQNFFYLAQREL
jgi:hypothetical protein